MVGSFRGGLSPQADVGIAQATLYVLAAPAVYAIFIKPKGLRPQITHLSLFVFSILRLVGATVNLVLSIKSHSEALRVPAIILFNIGLVPLLVATTGSIRFVDSEAFHSRRSIRSPTAAILASLGLAFVLLVVGNALESNSQVSLAGLAVARAGYAVIALALALIMVTLGYLMRHRSKLVESDRVPLDFTALSLVFLTIRTIYGFLFEFDPDPWHSRWNPVLGNALAHGLMGVGSEFLALFFQLVPFVPDTRK